MTSVAGQYLQLVGASVRGASAPRLSVTSDHRAGLELDVKREVRGEADGDWWVAGAMMSCGGDDRMRACDREMARHQRSMAMI